MKKLLALFAFVAITLVVNAANWAYIPINIPGDNHTQKSEFENFWVNRQPFIIDAADYYRKKDGTPMPASWYTTRVADMSRVSLKSLVGMYNGLKPAAKKQLLIDNGFNENTIIDSATAIAIFLSETVYVDDIPQGIKISFDGYNTETKDVAKIDRFAYTMNDGPEKGFMQKITGYKPFLILSAACGNRVSISWINAHLQLSGEDLPEDNFTGDETTKQTAEGPRGPQGPKGDKGNDGLNSNNTSSNLDMTSYLLGRQALTDYKEGIKDAAELLRNNCCQQTVATNPVNNWTPTTMVPQTPQFINVQPSMVPVNTGYNPGFVDNRDGRGYRIYHGIVEGSREVRGWVGMFLNRGCNGGGYSQPNYPNNPIPPYTPPSNGNCYWHTYADGTRQWLCPTNGQVGNPFNTNTNGNGQVNDPFDPNGNGQVGNPGGGFMANVFGRLRRN